MNRTIMLIALLAVLTLGANLREQLKFADRVGPDAIQDRVQRRVIPEMIVKFV